MSVNSIQKRENINKTRNAIRKKLKLLRAGEIDRVEKLKSTYKPITEPIMQLISSANQNKDNVMEKNKTTGHRMFSVKKDDVEENVFPEENKYVREIQDESVFESGPSGDPYIDDDDDESDLHVLSQHAAKIDSNQIKYYLEQYDPLPRYYIEKIITDGIGDFDTQYGVNYDITTSKWRIGDSEINLDGKDFVVKGIRYEGTPGIYELIFKKKPLGYKPEDEENYKDILERTNALHRNYDPKNQFQGTRSGKYSIIKNIVNKNKRANSWSGMGMNLQQNSSTEYRYWDDLDELVDRLFLLHASKNAGNNSHSNEILNIEQELKEAMVII